MGKTVQVDIERRKAIQKAWREANKEYLRARSKAYREANKQRLAAQQKAWREANSEYVKQREKNYRAKDSVKKRYKTTKHSYYLKNKNEITLKIKSKYEKNRESILKRRKELIAALPNYYIASGFFRAKVSEVPEDLIEAKKLVLMIRKEIKIEKRI